MTQNQVAKAEQQEANIAQAFYKSGFFSDIKSEAQAIVKIQAGKELGIGPMCSMKGFDIIEGKIRASSDLAASQIRKSGKYDYKILKHTEEECEIQFYKMWDGKLELEGKASFTFKEAEKLGLTNKKNWKYVKDMLFNRAMGRGARWYCPDVFSGSIYLGDELEPLVTVNVDSSGAEKLRQEANVITIEPMKVTSMFPECQESILTAISEEELKEIGQGIGQLSETDITAEERKELQELYKQKLLDIRKALTA